MAVSQIIDLDAILPRDKEVTLAGKAYRLPGDLPIELYLKIQRASKDLGDSGADSFLEEVYNEILELFRLRDKTVKTLPLGITQMLRVIPLVYASETVEGKPQTPKATLGASRTRSRAK
jgi:hypothetical protein